MKTETDLAPRQGGTVELRLPSGDGTVSKFEIDNTVPAHKNKEFLTGFAHMVLVSRSQPEWNNDHELAMWQEAMRREQVSPLEAYNAFWKAYQDPFTPASGVQWKNIWKHIQAAREDSYSTQELTGQEMEGLRALQKIYNQK